MQVISCVLFCAVTEYLAVITETISTQKSILSKAIIQSALYWYFMAKRRTYNTKDTNLSISWSKFFCTTHVFICNKKRNGSWTFSASQCLPENLYLTRLLWSCYNARLSLFIISFCDTQVLLLRPSWNPSRTNSSSFFANRFSSASFTTLSWLPFASLFLTVFFNIFFFSRILFGQRWTFILPLNFYGPKQKKQPCFWMIGDNC